MKRFIVLKIIFFFWNFQDVTLYDPSQCIAPLGMENGSIKDEDITASSSFDIGNVGPQHGRMRTEKNSGAWCPSKQATTEPEEWIQIDLKTVHIITSVGTQGRFGNGQGVEFAEAYTLEYWRPKLNKWIRYHNSKGEEVLKGNINTYLEAKRELDPPMLASKVRFYPYSYHKRTVCMRVELYGCRWTDGILSYSMPQGDKRGNNWEFYDFSYDGHWNGDYLKQGLGQLVDGKFGHDDFKTDFYNKDGQTWVGWKNDTRHNNTIDILFEFDKIRDFSSVHIYCSNLFMKDIQVFSMAKIEFSIGGKLFNQDKPITYEYMEDHIFENARNVTIKLHHRVGRFVKINLKFSSKWMMISEITFDSVIAHGNFSTEIEPTTISPSKIASKKDEKLKINLNESSDKITQPTYLTIIIVTLILIVILLKLIIFIIYRMRSKKLFRSPNSSDVGYAASTVRGFPSESVYGIIEKGNNIEAYDVTEIDEYRRSQSSTKGSLRSTLPLPYPLMENNEYQEPYQAMKYAPYYSYSPIVMEMQDSLPKKSNMSQSDSYDYVIPEAGKSPLLRHNDSTLPMSRSRVSSLTTTRRIPSRNSCDNTKKQSHSQQEALNALRKKLEETSLREFPKHRLRMISKLSEGAFGTVYIAEADGIYEYSSTTSIGTRLVAIKFLGETACEKEKKDFSRDVKILAALEDVNISRVLGVCTLEEPMCVIFEYLDHGDLCQFLKSHVSSEHNNTNPYGAKSLSNNCLLYLATQIAGGMRYLESLNFVHRDLATRNCLVGKAYQTKICDFGTYNEIYTNDYYKIDGNTPLPIRWMSWESVYQSKYTTKSDVWSFAVLFWEIITLARRQPYDTFSDNEVMENLANLIENEDNYFYLSKPTTDHDLYKLMLDCWKKNSNDRPTFTEIHLFLQRKNFGYAPT